MGRNPRFESRLIDAMNNVFRYRQRGRIEDGRFIHIVPETFDAVGAQAAVEGAPPCARLLPGEVWKHTGTGPDFAGKDGAVRVLDEVVSCNAAVEGRVILAGKICDMEVRNCHNVKIFSLELGNHAGKIREGCCVDAEGTIFLLEINVEIDSVGRNRV